MKRRDLLRRVVAAVLALFGFGESAQASGDGVVKTSQRAWASGSTTEFARSVAPAGWPLTQLEAGESLEQSQPRPEGKTLHVVSAGAYQTDGSPANGLKIQLNGSDILDNDADKTGDPIASVSSGTSATFAVVNTTGDSLFAGGHYQVKYE